MITLVDLGASGLTEGTNVPWAQCKDAPIDDEDAPDFDRPPIMGCLGVVARPAPANERGAAQGVIAETAGTDGVCIGGYDPRSSQMAGEISHGETAIGATGEDYDSRALFKEQLLALLVGDDHVLIIDRKTFQIALNCLGNTIKASKADGVVLCDASGKSSLQLKDGFSALIGEVVLGGRSPRSKVADATKVDAEINRIWSVLSGFIPSMGDGGAALKAMASGVARTKRSTKSAVSLG